MWRETSLRAASQMLVCGVFLVGVGCGGRESGDGAASGDAGVPFGAVGAGAGASIEASVDQLDATTGASSAGANAAGCPAGLEESAPARRQGQLPNGLLRRKWRLPARHGGGRLRRRRRGLPNLFGRLRMPRLSAGTDLRRGALLRLQP